MKKLKEWANANSWWLPWVGVVASISGLIFPDAYLRAGHTITTGLQKLLRYWVQVLIVTWGIYIHLEIKRLKKRKKARRKQSKNKVS